MPEQIGWLGWSQLTPDVALGEPCPTQGACVTSSKVDHRRKDSNDPRG